MSEFLLNVNARITSYLHVHPCNILYIYLQTKTPILENLTNTSQPTASAGTASTGQEKDGENETESNFDEQCICNAENKELMSDE